MTMRVAMIGLGSFAERAYLDHLASRSDVDLHLCTRDPKRLEELGARFRIAHRHRTWQEAVDAGVDAAFVHAATSAHLPIVEGLLRAGIPCYVDKPLDDSLPAARHLVEVAEQEGQSLMVGFNRRFAPAYQELAQAPRQVVVMQKHRTGLPTDIREFVFGDFIHVVDTLRFLAPGPVTSHHIIARMRGGVPQLLSLQVMAADFVGVGVTHRIESGSTEVVESTGDDGATRRVVDLDSIVTSFGAEDRISLRAMWSRTPWQRGIEQIVEEFLGAVREGRILSARDALATHELCEEIVAAAQAAAG